MTLRHPAGETAADKMARRVPVMLATQTAAVASARLRSGGFECIEAICVTDRDGRLTGIVPLAQLAVADPAAELGALMQPAAAAVPESCDQERAAAMAAEHGVTALPVVDAERRPVGVLTAATLIAVLEREHTEDVHKLAGIVHGTEQARHALETPVAQRVALRLPWLLLGLAGSLAAAGVVAAFEGALAADVAVAFFIPAIVYLADAVGTQTEAVSVRGLSASHRPLGALLTGEVAVGAALGLALGLIAWPAVALLFGNATLGLAVGIAIFAASIAASAIGLILPWMLSRFRFDPAYGSGPVATVLQDMLSLLVYFAVVIALV